MCLRVFSGKADGDAILGDDPQLRRKVPELGRMHFTIAASDFDGVVTDDAQIRERFLLRMQQQPPHARSMHLDAEMIGLRVRFRESTDHLAGAEPDLQTARRATPEECVEVERPAVEIHAE